MAARKKGPMQLLRAAIETHLIPVIEAAGFEQREDLQELTGWDGDSYNWAFSRPGGPCLWLHTERQRNPMIVLQAVTEPLAPEDWLDGMQHPSVHRPIVIPMDTAKRFDPLAWLSGSWFWQLPTVLRAVIWAVSLPVILVLALVLTPFFILRKPALARPDVQSGVRQEAMAKTAARRFAKLKFPR